MRPQLFRLTSETEDNNDELMVILRLTDEVNRIINLCKEKHPDIINMPRYIYFNAIKNTVKVNDLLIRKKVITFNLRPIRSFQEDLNSLINFW